MPGPPPPPPPAGGPPPPMPAAVFAPPKGGKGGGDERSALLNAIRKQPKLNRVDKALINDRSDPLANAKPSAGGGNNRAGGGSPTAASQGGGGGGAMMNGPPNGLGGLFQGGMPKLKSVNRNNSTLSNHTNGPESAPTSLVSSASNTSNSFGDIQQELRKRLNNDSRNTNRGPAPPAPSRNITNELSSLQSKNGYQINHNKTNNSQTQPQHRKTQSNGNFNTLESPTTPGLRNNNNTTPAKSNFGKPNLAPKPPVLEKPINNTLHNGKLRKSNSVRLPSSPLSTAAPASYNGFGLAANHLPMDMERSRTLGGSTPHLSPFRLRPSNGRPTVPPPSIPAPKVKPPSQAPPPPPSAAPTTPLPAAPTHAPPPPPHRAVPAVPTRAAPAVPTTAPAPPPRNSSIRTNISISTFESRYVFRPMSEFPPPMAFRNVEKVYTTARQAGKQQAPQPPSGSTPAHSTQQQTAAALPPQHQQLQLAGGHRLWESSTC